MEEGKLKIEENEKIEAWKSGQAAKADSLDGFGEEKRCFEAVCLAWGISGLGAFWRFNKPYETA